MRADRLVAILLQLQTRRRLTAGWLAHALEVSERTVLRDMEALESAGVPIVSVRGTRGGFELVSGFHADLTQLHDDEAAALHLLGLPTVARALGLDRQLSRAQLKLNALLSDSGRASAHEFSNRFLFEPEGCEPATDTVALLRSAIWRQSEVRATFAGEDGLRVFEPLGLVLRGPKWFVVATADGVQFRAPTGQLRDLTMTGRRFERPAGFNLGACWAALAAEDSNGS